MPSDPGSLVTSSVFRSIRWMVRVSVMPNNSIFPCNGRVRRAASHRPHRSGGRPGLEPDTRNPLVHWSTAPARIWIESLPARELPRCWLSSLLKIGRRNISHPLSNCHNTGMLARSIPAKMDEDFGHRLTLPKPRSRKSSGLAGQSATGSHLATSEDFVDYSTRSRACGLRSHRFRPGYCGKVFG